MKKYQLLICFVIREKFEKVNILNGHKGWVTCLCLNMSSDLLVSGSSDKTIKIWDLKSGKCVDSISGHEGTLWSLAFCNNGKHLVSSSEYGQIMVHELIQ